MAPFTLGSKHAELWITYKIYITRDVAVPAYGICAHKSPNNEERCCSREYMSKKERTNMLEPKVSASEASASEASTTKPSAKSGTKRISTKCIGTKGTA